MGLVAEFIVEPFVPGNPGAHVTAALDAARDCGAALEFGPFGTLLRAADDDGVLRAIDAAVRAAVAGGASRVSFQVFRNEESSDAPTGDVATSAMSPDAPAATA